MIEKHTDVRRTGGVRKSETPLAAGALATVILLVTVGDVAGVQAGTTDIVAAYTVQSILGSSAVAVSGGGSGRVIEIPRKADVRSPYQPPSWTPGPPPWAPGKPSWVPGPPAWVSKKADATAPSKFRTTLSKLVKTKR